MDSSASSTTTIHVSKFYEFKGYQFAYLQPEQHFTMTAFTKILLNKKGIRGAATYVIVVEVTEEFRAFNASLSSQLTIESNPDCPESLYFDEEMLPPIFNNQGERIINPKAPWTGVCKLLLAAVRVTKRKD